jgi:hypothetical protein
MSEGIHLCCLLNHIMDPLNGSMSKAWECTEMKDTCQHNGKGEDIYGDFVFPENTLRALFVVEAVGVIEKVIWGPQ